VHVKSRFDELFSGTARAELEARLASYITPRRWFRSKTRALVAASLEHVLALPVDGADVALAVVRLRYVEGEDDEYLLPLTWVRGDAGEHLAQTRPHLVVGSVDVEGEPRPRWLVDALGERRALEGWLALVAGEATVRIPGACLTFRSVAGAGDTRGALDTAALPSPVEAEQSNTSVVFGGECILKVVRKLENGASPDLEMGECLTRAGYPHTPSLLAAIELERPSREPATVGVVHAFVPNEGDAWSFALATIARAAVAADADRPLRRAIVDAGGDAAAVAVATSVAFVPPLATRIAEMHAALASATSDSRFSPEPIEESERRALGLVVEQSLSAAWSLVEERGARLSTEALERLRSLREREAAYRETIARFVQGGFRCMKTRVHGDLHLGQVLVSGDGFVLIDFEGEPARPLAERKAKRSPMVDVAGMLRSLHYASVAAVRDEPHADAARAFARGWHREARQAFLRAYDEASVARSVLPDETEARSILRRFYLLEKCVYELHYELNNRPDWVAIPLLGLESLLDGSDEPRTSE
jgi:trehalose synthase-fused probable maltokinase